MGLVQKVTNEEIGGEKEIRGKSWEQNGPSINGMPVSSAV